jgi:hypothetical protein
MDRYRVLVTGDRHWYCLPLAEAIVTRLKAKHGPALLVVHGAANGVDSAFADACLSLGVDQEPHAADWETHGRAGGPIRNSAMVALGADVCLAFSPDLAKSHGTRDCSRKAIAAGIPTWLVAEDRGPDTRPVRLEEV